MAKPVNPNLKPWPGTVEEWQEHVQSCDGSHCDWIAPPSLLASNPDTNRAGDQP